MPSSRRHDFCGSPRSCSQSPRFFSARWPRGAAAFRGRHDGFSTSLKTTGPRGRAETKEQAGDPPLAGPAARASLKTWDPKPGTSDGWSISVRSRPRFPGIEISELMPKMAPAHGEYLHHSFAQHQERRPRRRCKVDDARPARTMRASPLPRSRRRFWPRELGQGAQQRARLCVVLLADRGDATWPRGRLGFLGERFAPMHLTTEMIPEKLAQARRNLGARPSPARRDSRSDEPAL